MHWCVPPNRETLAEIRPGCGPFDVVPEDEPCVLCREEGSLGGPGPGAYPPDTQEAFPQEYWWRPARESLWQRKLSQATSCDRLARISFMAWKGPQIWKPQHYDAAHGMAFLAPLSPAITRMKWNRKHIICMWAVSNLGAVSQARNGRSRTLTPFSGAIRLP